MEKEKNVLIVSQYAAPHAGNYIASLLDLQKDAAGNGYKLYYAFPKNAEKCDWIRQFQVDKLLFLSDPMLGRLRRNPQTHDTILQAVETWKIQVIHTNFDGYDAAAAKVCREKNIPLIISFHDPIVKLDNPIKNLYQWLCLKKHYWLDCRNGYVIFVNEALEQLHQKLCIKHYTCINNGLSLNKIHLVRGGV